MKLQQVQSGHNVAIGVIQAQPKQENKVRVVGDSHAE